MTTDSTAKPRTRPAPVLTADNEFFWQGCQAVQAGQTLQAKKSCEQNICGTAAVSVETKPRVVLLLLDSSASRTECTNGSLDCLSLPGTAGRSLTDFYMAVASQEIKEALEFYLNGILDDERDNLSMSRFVVFEMDELYRLNKKTTNGVLFYIFARIRRKLRSDIPTLVAVDEFREALSHPLAAKCFEQFLFEGRKLNMSVWLVLQELSKVLQSPLKDAVMECAPSASVDVV